MILLFSHRPEASDALNIFYHSGFGSIRRGYPMNIESIRDEMEAFRRESGWEWYQSGAGLKDEIHMAAIYARYPLLFSRENVEEAASSLAGAETSGDADAARRLRELRAALTMGFIREDLKELSDRAVNFESAAKIKSPDGEEIPYRQSAVLLLNEPDRSRRAALESARMKVAAKKNDFLAPIHQKTHALAARLGYSGYLEMMAGVALVISSTLHFNFVETRHIQHMQVINSRTRTIGCTLAVIGHRSLLFSEGFNALNDYLCLGPRFKIFR